MKSKILLLALLSILISISSCDKSDESYEYLPSSPIPKIKTISGVDNLGATYTFLFEYDELGRIIKRDYNNQLYEKFVYVSDSLILIEQYSANYSTTGFFHVDTLRLNDQGLMIASQRRLFYIYSDDDTYFFGNGSREYDAAGYLINISQSYGYNQALKIMDGNTVELIYSNRVPYSDGENAEDSIISQTYMYEFYANTTNTIGNENKGMSFLGKQDKNLVQGIKKYKDDEPVPASPLVTYSYELDSQKRVIKKTSVSENTGNSSTKSYTYY